MIPAYAERVWHARDGLPEETIQAFTQTRDRFLWIGTTDGLVRFDGDEFVSFDHDNVPELSENSIFCLLAGQDGTLWIGTEGGGLVSYRDGAFRLWSKQQGLTNNYVRALREDNRGRLWIGTDAGLFQMRDGRVERIDGRNQIPSIAVHAIYQDVRGRMWVGGFHLLRFDEQGTRPVEIQLPRGQTDNVKSILQSNDGTVWIGTVSGLQVAEASGTSDTRLRRIREIHSTVRTLLEHDGAIWIGTIGDGLLAYRDGQFSKVSRLPSKTVLSSFSTKDGNLWVGTQSGLVRLNKASIETLELPDFADADFGTIYGDRDGTLWIAGTHLFHLEDGHAAVVRLPPPLADVRVRTVFRDRSGTLWFGTEGKGAYRMLRGIPSAVPSQAYVRAFAQDRAGDIWIGSDGGYCRWSPTTFGCYEPSESVRAIHVDRQGAVWVAKDRGLTRLDEDGTHAGSPIAALRDKKVWAIHEDDDGGLWFGTRKNGLFLWKSKRLSAFTTAQGLTSNSIYQILEDSKRVLWLSGPNGISSICRKDLEATALDPLRLLPVNVYGASEGLETTQMYGGVQPAGTVSARGEIWFASTAGAIRVASEESETRAVPKPVIYTVAADGRAVKLTENVTLPPGQGKLDVRFGAIQFRSPEHVRFRYRLNGFDNNWTETRTRHASYTGLPAGHYRFDLVAFDRADPSNASTTSVSVDWRPHVYRTWWFYTTCAVFAAASVVWMYRLRMQHARARFDAVLGERNRLAREMHDTLIQGCTAISAVLEGVASLSNQEGMAAQTLLDCARTQIRAITDEARSAVWNLHNGGQHEISDLVSQMANQACNGADVTLCLETSGKGAILDPAVEHDVLMATREALFNALRHAHPKQILLQIKEQNGRVSIRIHDDGCGFNPLEVARSSNGHFGLIGMQERIERIGGHLKIGSSAGQGTDVCLEVPLQSLRRVTPKSAVRA